MDLSSQHGCYLQVSLLTALVYVFFRDLNSVYCTSYDPARFYFNFLIRLILDPVPLCLLRELLCAAGHGWLSWSKAWAFTVRVGVNAEESLPIHFILEHCAATSYATLKH